METQLDIYVDEELLNPKILILRDISYYGIEDEEVSGGTLDIQYPGTNSFMSYDIPSGFFEIVNSNVLEITNECSRNLAELPDGIWTIKYSIEGGKFVEYSFLRNVQQRIKYANTFCSLNTNKCSYREYKDKFDDLKEINNFITAAKYLAYCCKYDKAIQLYEVANELLENFYDDCNCK
jgi:hypothetical protein